MKVGTVSSCNRHGKDLLVRQQTFPHLAVVNALQGYYGQNEAAKED
jgi:hypothetical protein